MTSRCPVSDDAPPSEVNDVDVGGRGIDTAELNGAPTDNHSTVTVLAEQIGPRPAGSVQECRAAEHVLGWLGRAEVPAIGLPVRVPVVSAWPELSCLTGALCGLLLALVSGRVGLVVVVIVLALYVSDVLHHPRVMAALPDRRSTNVLAILA